MIDFAHAFESYGIAALGLVVGLESMGLPLPGEGALIAGSLYASRHPGLPLWHVIGAAAIGAVIGDNIGYVIGRRLGAPLLARYGGRIGLTEDRLKLGRYLFARYGGRVVLFGRFVAILRTWAALFAGANHMPWRRFLVANAVGGLAWASFYALAAATFGHAIHRLAGRATLGIGLVAVAGVAVAAMILKRHEAALTQAAQAAYPGPLRG